MNNYGATRLPKNQHDGGMNKLSYVYIFDSAPHLFIGVTSDLERRTAQARRKLVWFEPHADMAAAIAREKQLKTWSRGWKAKLVSNDNPEWRDLFAEVDRRRAVRDGAHRPAAA
jgi:putative endonuclease